MICAQILFIANDLTFTIYNQVTSVPDPSDADTLSGSALDAWHETMKQAIVPAVWMEITIDNTSSDRSRRAFIGYSRTDPYTSLRHLDNSDYQSLKGVGQGSMTAIASLDENVHPATGFSMEKSYHN